MKAQTLIVENPTKKLLQFFRNFRADKQEHKAKLIAKKDMYFLESK